MCLQDFASKYLCAEDFASFPQPKPLKTKWEGEGATRYKRVIVLRNSPRFFPFVILSATRTEYEVEGSYSAHVLVLLSAAEPSAEKSRAAQCIPASRLYTCNHTLRRMQPTSKHSSQSRPFVCSVC